MYGYNGKIALVDVTNRTARTIDFDEDFARTYIGGSGMGTFFLLKYCTPGTEALAPENPLIYMTGPYQGTGIPTSGRHQVVTRSPLTGAFLESDAGGTFGFHLKQAGFDGLVILGRSEKPLCLTVFEGIIGFRDAEDLWGLDTMETAEKVSEIFGRSMGLSCIGPAGENQVLLAGIFHDGPDARAAGRGGAGAVMGSKNIKCIVAGGNSTTKVMDRSSLTASIREKNALLKEKAAGLTLYGTAGGTAAAEELGDLPVKNWSEGSFPAVEAVTGQKMADTILADNYGCKACPIRCGRVVELDDRKCGGPEYETVAMLGSCCLVEDLETIARANDLCNRMGLDTISTGSVIAFSMELYEKGLLTEKSSETPIKWGDGSVVLELIEKMARKRGIGILLGQGTKKVAKKIGKGAEAFAIQSKGLEFPAHDPRCFKSLASGYATSVRGACHLNSYSYPWERSAAFPELGYPEKSDRTKDEGKGVMTAKFQNLSSMLDSLKICKFALLSGVDVGIMRKWLTDIAGWDISQKEFLETGERIYNMKRLFNTGMGFRRSDDTLPERILREARGSGGSPDLLPDLEMQLEEYYRFRNWDKEGVPEASLLRRLGLQEFINWLPG
ncbi:MAG: aldehyde ferredoxin oxidoreductase family protein [Thermovirgaceae bacterium]